METDTPIESFISGLRKLADFYEKHPDTPMPYTSMHAHFYGREEFIKAALALAKGGKITKGVHNSMADDRYTEYRAERKFDGITISFSIDRKAVCRLVRAAEYECPDSLLEEEAAEYERNAHVAEPLREVVNAIAPEL